MKRTLLVGSSLLLACGSPATRPATEDTLGGADTTTVRTTGGGTGSSGGSGGSGGSTGGGTPTPDPVTRFLVIGDTGKDFDTSIPLADRWTSVPQYVVARGVKKACDAKGGCAFAVMLGDNFYKTGVSGVDDPQWQTKFEQPYADLAFPFHPVHGNHDYGQGGIGFEFNTDIFYKGKFEVDYTAHSTKWKMPAAYHAFHEGPVDFVALDTNQITFDPMFGSKTSTAAQAAWIDQSIPTLAGPWRIAMGHHPYLSNGDHGNAGNYSGNETLNALALAGLSALGGSAQNATQSFQGKAMKEFLEAHVCGKVDVYFAGHDHSLQDLKKPTSCATEFIVSGAGGSHTKVVEDRNPYWFQSAEDGFLIAEATRTKLVLTFFNKTGDQLHTRTITK